MENKSDRDSTTYNSKAFHHYTPIWFSNIRSFIDDCHYKKSGLELYQKGKGKKLVLCASGASLNNITKFDTEGKTVISGVTSASALMHAGIMLDYLVVADPNPVIYEKFIELTEWKLFQSKPPLVLLPITASPEFYATPRGALYSAMFRFYLPYIQPQAGGDVHNVMFNMALKALVPEIDLYITQAGAVSNTMLQLAELLYGGTEGHVELYGYDNSYGIHNERERVPWYSEAGEIMDADRKTHESERFLFTGVYTDAVQLRYALASAYLMSVMPKISFAMPFSSISLLAPLFPIPGCETVVSKETVKSLLQRAQEETGVEVF